MSGRLSQTVTVVFAIVAVTGIAACGSSSSPKDIGEIQSCLTAANLQVRGPLTIGDSKSVLVALPGGTAAPVEVDSSDSDAQKQASDWKAFGAAGGKTGTTVINGSVWVGYPGQVPGDIKSKIEGCAF
jgi:hypothetical protein